MQSQPGLTDKIIESILPILQNLWAAAWGAGWEAAAEVEGIESLIDQQQLQGYLRQYGAAWARQIAATTLKIMAGVLAAAGAAITVAALMSAMQDAGRWRDVAQTEVTRGMSEAAAALYRAGGATHIRWVTEPGACELCLANEHAGSWPLGVPFPSGALWPPQHPNCRCFPAPA